MIDEQAGKAFFAKPDHEAMLTGCEESLTRALERVAELEAENEKLWNYVNANDAIGNAIAGLPDKSATSADVARLCSARDKARKALSND